MNVWQIHIVFNIKLQYYTLYINLIFNNRIDIFIKYKFYAFHFNN